MAEPKIKIVNLEEVMELHEEWLRRLGGIAGIRNHEVLMYALRLKFRPITERFLKKPLILVVASLKSMPLMTATNAPLLVHEIVFGAQRLFASTDF